MNSNYLMNKLLIKNYIMKNQRNRIYLEKFFIN